jgi:hypothetical protein
MGRKEFPALAFSLVFLLTGMGMRKCFSAAIVLMTWYLMLPPPIFPPVKQPNGDFAVNVKAPFSQWLTLKTFATQSQCKAELKHKQPYDRCVSSDEPSLKQIAKPEAAPSTSTAAGAIGTHMQ